MAKVIIGGQMLSLVLALVVTPVFYVILDQWKNLTRRMGIRFSVEPRSSTAKEHAPAPQPIKREEAEIIA